MLEIEAEDLIFVEVVGSRSNGGIGMREGLDCSSGMFEGKEWAQQVVRAASKMVVKRKSGFSWLERHVW